MRFLSVLQPIRRRLPLLICALLLTVVTAFSWVALRRFEQVLLAAGGERVRGAARQLASVLEDQARRGRAEWKLEASDSAVERYLRSQGKQDAVRAGEAIGRRLAAGTQLMALQLRGADGGVLLSVGAVPKPAAGESRRTAASPNSLSWGGSVGPFSTSGDTVYYEVVRPVVPARGDTIGYLAHYRRLSANGPSAQLIRGLIGADATVVLGNEQGGVWTDLAGPAAPPAARVELGRPIAVTGRAGEPALGVAARIKGTPWLVVVALPRRDLLRPARELLETTAWLAAIVLALGALGAWALSRRITGPLTEMTRAADGFAAGDYSRRVAAESRGDELGQLARSFNGMARRVDETTQELEHQMEQLQEQAVELEQQTEQLQEQAAELEASNEDLSRALADTRQARDEARAAEERYHVVVDSLAVGVVLLDAADGIVAANPAAERILGLTLDQMRGRGPVDGEWGLVREDGAPQLPDENPSVIALKTGKPVSNIVVGVRRPDASRAWLEVNVQPLSRPGESTPYAAVTSFVDLTVRKQLEAQLLQSQKMDAVGQLAGGVAHDFNNLLTVITGYGAILLETLDKSDPTRADLEEIQRAAERAAGLTRQLLAFSRKQLLQPRVLDLNGEIVAELEKMLRRLIGEDIELATSLDPNLGLVNADPGQLEQVIVNLAVNARDAMPKGGRLVIQTANAELGAEEAGRHLGAKPGRYAMLAVSDTGTGMSRETLSRMFEPFYTTKEQGKGTGLGLATVHGIVKQSGGDIWVYSEPGQGTTFKIYLPLVEDPVTEPASVPPRQVEHGAGETILLVEDEDGLRTLAKKILLSRGYTVVEARNGEEALAICERAEQRIDLMLTDAVMPGMSGRALAERVAELRPSARVLVMSGYTDDDMLRRGILDPRMAFVQKPFAPDALAKKVREVLGASAAGVPAPSLPQPGSRTPTTK